MIPRRRAPLESTATRPIVANIKLHRVKPPRVALPKQGKIVESPMVIEDFLVKILKRAKKEVREPRDGAYLHVSDLIHRCVRKIALVEAQGLKMPRQYLTSTDQTTFAQGDAIHEVVRKMAMSGDASKVWGLWKCACGNLTHATPCTYAQTDPEDKCEYCLTATDQYVEISLRDDDLMIVGHPDLILRLDSIDGHHVVEIKSIADKAWKELARPLPEHVIQVMMYWYLMRKLGYNVTDRVTILYVTKGWMFSGEPWKEFQLDPKIELPRLDALIKDARDLKDSRETGIYPRRQTACTSEMTREAQQCAVHAECFRCV